MVIFTSWILDYGITCLLMSSSYKATSKPPKIYIGEDDTIKKGACLLELRRPKMVKWGSCRQPEFIGHNRESNLQLPSTAIKEENNHQFPSFNIKQEQQDEASLETDSILMPNIQTSKGLIPEERGQAGAKRRIHHRKDGLTDKCKKINHDCSTTRKESLKNRWGVDRYNLAEKHMLDVMKAEGAVFENPITRPALRIVARNYIGDTGLLDHLLKHIDGKVAPGGTERFRRCYNTEGVMQYWLESVEQLTIKCEGGLPYSNLVPPPHRKPGSIAFGDSVSAAELASLKEDIMELKRSMEEMACKKQEQSGANQIGEILRELVKWRGETDQRLTEISGSLVALQNMCKDLVAWKPKIEQQLIEVTNLLSSIQASKQCTSFDPASDGWEDWLEPGNLDNLQEEDFTPCFEGTEFVNVTRDDSVQEPYSASQPWSKLGDTSSQGSAVFASELEFIKEEMARMKRDVQALVKKRLEDDQANVTPDSSTTANSKLELDGSILLSQEMIKELVKWKDRTEKQMVEVSNSVSTLLGSEQCTT